VLRLGPLQREQQLGDPREPHPVRDIIPVLVERFPDRPFLVVEAEQVENAGQVVAPVGAAVFHALQVARDRVLEPQLLARLAVDLVAVVAPADPALGEVLEQRDGGREGLWEEGEMQ
jgi:hypothetical protein